MENENTEDRFVFWDGSGRIVPHLLYEYFATIDIGIYFPDNSNKNNSEPLIVEINVNIVSPESREQFIKIKRSHA